MIRQFGEFAPMVDYLHSLLSLSAIVNGIIGSAIFAGAVAALVYIWNSLCKVVTSSAESNRKYALADIRKRVRSDEYHAERQKIEVNALVIATGSLVMIVALLPPYEAGNEYASVVWVAVLLLLISGLLFHLETRRNGTALKMRMRIERRKRVKRLKQRRKVSDVR